MQLSLKQYNVLLFINLMLNVLQELKHLGLLFQQEPFQPRRRFEFRPCHILIGIDIGILHCFALHCSYLPIKAQWLQFF